MLYSRGGDLPDGLNVLVGESVIRYCFPPSHLRSVSYAVGDIIGHSFDFGFQVGVAALPEDIKPGETVLDIDLSELPEDPDAQ